MILVSSGGRYDEGAAHRTPARLIISKLRSEPHQVTILCTRYQVLLHSTRCKEVYRHIDTVDSHWTRIYSPWVGYTDLFMLHIFSLR